MASTEDTEPAQKGNKSKKSRRFSLTTHQKGSAVELDVSRRRTQMKEDRRDRITKVRGNLFTGGEKKIDFVPGVRQNVPDHINLMLELILQQGLMVKKIPQNFPYYPQDRVLLLSAFPAKVVCCRPGDALLGNYSKGLDVCEIQKILLGEKNKFPETDVFQKAKGIGDDKKDCCLSIVGYPPERQDPEESTSICLPHCLPKKRNKKTAIPCHRKTIDIMVQDPDQMYELALALALYIQKVKSNIKVDEDRRKAAQETLTAERLKELDADNEQSAAQIRRISLFKGLSGRNSNALSPGLSPTNASLRRSSVGRSAAPSPYYGGRRRESTDASMSLSITSAREAAEALSLSSRGRPGGLFTFDTSMVSESARREREREN